MPAVPARVPCGAQQHGGIAGYPLDQLYQEVAFLAYHVHWSHDDVMGMEHPDRRRWVMEIADINRRMNEA